MPLALALSLPSAARLRRLVVVLGLAPLAACQTTGPDTGVPVPAAFKADRSGTAEPLRRDWVTAFGSAELNRLVAIAEANNFDIEGAIARINQAEAQAVVASAALFPTLNGTADVSRQKSSATSRSSASNGGTSFTSNAFQLGLSASYTLDLFGQNRFAARAAQDSALAAVYDRSVVELATASAVANAYFALLSAQDRLRIAEDNIRIAERVLGALRGRLNAGTGTALDIAQQESTLATQKARVPPLVQAIQQNRNTLAVLLGRVPESLSVKGGSLRGLRLARVRPGLPSDLLLRRPDIAVAEAQLSAAELNVASARAAFFPTIQLTGSGGYQSAALASLINPASLAYSVAAGLTQPILDGWRLQGQLDLQQGRSAEIAATYKKAIVQSFADVENALIAVRQTAELEARQRDSVEASRRALDISEARLREGTIDIVTLFTVQTTLFQAQDSLALAQLQRFQALVSLYQALGGGFTQERTDPIAGPDGRKRSVKAATAP